MSLIKMLHGVKNYKLQNTMPLSKKRQGPNEITKYKLQITNIKDFLAECNSKQKFFRPWGLIGPPCHGAPWTREASAKAFYSPSSSWLLSLRVK